MAECPICRNHFFLLEDNAHCQKCRAKTPGLSKSEIVVINVTIDFSEFIGLHLLTDLPAVRTNFSAPHAVSYPLILKIHCATSALNTTVSSSCLPDSTSKMNWRYIGKADDVPAALLRLKGVPAVLFEENDEVGTDRGSRRQSALASAILDLSREYRSQASDTRLHNKVRTIGSSSNREHESSSASGSNTFKNLGKANKVVAERKKKLEESKLNDTGIRIAGTLWQSEKNKLTQVNFSF